MNKPDGVTPARHHHFAAYLGATFLCEHTCNRGQPSVHRNTSLAVEHVNDVHALVAELEKFPTKKRTQAIAGVLLDELFAHDSYLQPHIYAAVWHQLQQAITS
jgi:hypothetical protein